MQFLAFTALALALALAPGLFVIVTVDTHIGFVTSIESIPLCSVSLCDVVLVANLKRACDYTTGNGESN